MRGTEQRDGPALDGAIAKSPLARMSNAARERIVSSARPAELLSKAYLVHTGDLPRCALVIDGLVRTVRTSIDGRDLTLHWAGRGEIIGLTTAITPPAPAAIQAVTDTQLLQLSVPGISDLARSDATVAWAIAEYATHLLRRAIDELVVYAYGDLRTRIERRLLDFACRMPPGTPLVARLTQAELAEAVGAARPSVARVLKQLRDEGAITSMYGGVLIVRPEVLAGRSGANGA